MSGLVDNKILYAIRQKFQSRYDAEESEEEEKPKKKATGWGTRLPYGLCKSIGIDTTGMTPTEAWEAYENETGKSADEMYAEKAEKGEGKVIDAENPEGEGEDYSSMSEDDLKQKADEIQKKIDDAMDKAVSSAHNKKKFDKYAEEIEQLQAQKDKVTEALNAVKPSETVAEAKGVDYSTMSQEGLSSTIDKINSQIQEVYDNSSGDLLTPDEVDKIDQLYAERDEAMKYFKGYDYAEPVEETDISALSKADLEYVLGGTVEEFENGGGFTKSGEGYINPLTAEYFTEEEKNQLQESIDKQKSEEPPKEKPEEPDDIPFGDEPEDVSEPADEESIKQAIKDNDANIEKFQSTLTGLGFTNEDVASDDFENVIHKYEALGDFYDAYQKAVDWKEEHGINPDDDHWFSDLSTDQQFEYYGLYEGINNAGNALGEFGIYDMSYFNGTVDKYDRDAVENILQNKESAIYYGELLKEEKLDKSMNEKALSGIESKPTDDIVNPKEEPKKYTGTVKQLQKKIEKVQEEIDALKKQQLTTEDGKAVPTYGDFEKFIQKGGDGDKVKTVEDYFDKHEKVATLYKLLDTKNKMLEDYGLKGMTPNEAYEKGLIPTKEYEDMSLTYSAVESAIKNTQKELTDKYGFTFNDKGEPFWDSKSKSEMILSWKDTVLGQGEKIKALQSDIDGMSKAVEQKEKGAKIKTLGKEQKALKAEADKLQSEYESLKEQLSKKSYAFNPYNDEMVTFGDLDQDLIEQNEEGLDWFIKNGKGSEEYKASLKTKMEKLNEAKTDVEALNAKKKALEDAKQKADKVKDQIDILKGKTASSTAFSPDAYSQERKDNAMWDEGAKETDAYLFETSSRVWKEASHAQKVAAYDYTTSSDSYNYPLRDIGYGDSTDPVSPKIKALTEIIDKSTYDRDIWVQRGCDMYGMDKFFGCDMDLLKYGDDEALQALVGTEPIEYGFFSTGAGKGTGFGGSIIMNTYLPRGTKGLYCEPFSYYGGASSEQGWSKSNLWDGEYHSKNFHSEMEILLQQGTRFRITKITRENGTLYVDLEVISQTPRYS